jgi:hypothetical protein
MNTAAVTPSWTEMHRLSALRIKAYTIGTDALGHRARLQHFEGALAKLQATVSDTKHRVSVLRSTIRELGELAKYSRASAARLRHLREDPASEVHAPEHRDGADRSQPAG